MVMQTKSKMPTRVAASPVVYLATQDYSGPAGSWPAGSAVIISDPAFVEWLVREAALVAASMTPVTSPAPPQKAPEPVVAPVEATPSPVEPVPVSEATPEAEDTPEPATEASGDIQAKRGRPRGNPKGGGR